MSPLARRLAKVEAQFRPVAREVFVWRETGETEAATIERHRLANADVGDCPRFVLLQWTEQEGAAA